MKVYRCPPEVPFDNNYEFVDGKFDLAKHEANIVNHQKDLKAYLIKAGYKGKHTGEIVHFGVADGAAQYMLADGPKACLIHLPYDDAYHYRDVGFLPKAEILRRIEQDKKLRALFAKK